jgi:hypothetical protein
MPAPSAWLAGNSQISAIVGEGANCREGHFALALNPVPATAVRWAACCAPSST